MLAAARRDPAGGPRPLVILGPTASGKSDVGMAFAGEVAGAEILAVDSMQVYRRMDIGTAKPDLHDQQMVKHHGIDLAEPSADFAVAEFVRYAEAALADMADRLARPVLVAGTGLYLRAVTDPMEMPGTWPDLRAAWERRAESDGAEALHAILVVRDPQAASKMEPSNVRRIVRALEVIDGSGRTFSSFGPGLDSYPDIDVVQIGLRWARPRLAERIEARVHRMVERGLLAEVEALSAEPAGLSRTAQQALGYKELLEHLDGDCSFDEAVERVVVRTRQFAVRQERWFRRDPRIHWVDVHDNPVAEVLPVLRDWLTR